MTPHDIHCGLAAAKWQQRAEVLRAAYAAHSERFPRGSPRPCRRRRESKSPVIPALVVPEGAGW
jgi:hypothetical protein